MKKKKPKQRAAIGVLGKALTRRSRGRCELCEGRDGVRPYELHPFPADPDPERTLMACNRCREWIERETIDPVEAHFLGGAVWSDHAPVRLAAARLLLCHEHSEHPWMSEALDASGIDPQTREFAH